MNTKIAIARAFILPAALIAGITIGTKCNSDKRDNVNQPNLNKEIKNDHQKEKSN